MYSSTNPDLRSNSLTMFSKITISGKICTGKTSVFRELHKKLQWPTFSSGAHFREYAKIHNLVLNDAEEQIAKITKKIDRGDLSNKPGWVRLSLHPINTNAEIYFILNAINEIVINHKKWIKDYDYSARSNEFFHKSGYTQTTKLNIENWFKI